MVRDSDLVALGKQLGAVGRCPAEDRNLCGMPWSGSHLCGGDDYPKLSGQPQIYLSRQLHLFQQRIRGGSENEELMHPIVDKLTDEQIEALVAYYA
ncbi:MAG: hypothetical protein R3C05_20285 [Pirellulaceae bacterium]